MQSNRKFAISLLLFAVFIMSIFVALSASITKTWTNIWLSDASIASTIDDQVNNLSTAIQERQQNSGQYWPSSNDSKSGINVVQSSNFVSNEWSVYESDLVSKALTLTDSTATVLSPTTLSSTLTVTGTSTFTGAATASNDLTVNGNFSAANDKRILVATISGRGDGSAPDIENAGFYIPQGVTGTIIEAELTNNSTFSSGIAFLRKVSPTWSTNTSSTDCITSGTVFATLSPLAGQRHVRTTTISSATISAADVLCVDRSTSFGGYAQANIYIQLDW